LPVATELARQRVGRVLCIYGDDDQVAEAILEGLLP
jgi:type IV secretory pathway VirJ component